MSGRALGFLLGFPVFNIVGHMHAPTFRSYNSYESCGVIASAEKESAPLLARSSLLRVYPSFLCKCYQTLLTI